MAHHAYLEAATARQIEEWRSRAWSDQWRLGWEANRMLHEWGLGEQYSRVDRPASSVESTLSSLCMGSARDLSLWSLLDAYRIVSRFRMSSESVRSRPASL